MSARRRWSILAGIPLAVLVVIVVAWAADGIVGGERVARNVTVAGIELGGLERDDVAAVADRLTSELADETVSIQVDDTEFVTDPVSLGVEVDRSALVDDALEARRGGFPLFRPFTWLGTFITEHELEVPHVADPGAGARAVDQLVNQSLDEPVEPVFGLTGGRLTVSPGAQGLRVDAEAVAAEILPAVEDGSGPYVIEAESIPVDPELDTERLEELADEANDATAFGVTVAVADQTAEISTAQLRDWIVLDTSGDTPTWRIDHATAVAQLATEFPLLGGEDQQARFDIQGGVPVILPASETVVCCDDDTGERLEQGLRDGDDPIELDVKITGGDDGVDALETLGIVEEVASFTTNHNCCENRVTNIHLIADYVRGAVVLPGESFSLNGYVGRRTAERGFLPAGAIAQGIVEQEVGGGVSQFATTLFNAVFFAGLDFVEYQSHSLYFSRYPRGREATISWPKPDLVFENNTPYGVLIWPTYTDTSITVTLYSTEHIEVVDAGRSEGAQGACTRVTTFRERTFPDGSTDRDSVFAVYRPGEGFDCNGNPTSPDVTTTTAAPETTETSEGTETTAPPSSDTTAPPTTAPPTTAPPTTEPPTTAPPSSAEGE